MPSCHGQFSRESLPKLQPVRHHAKASRSIRYDGLGKVIWLISLNLSVKKAEAKGIMSHPEVVVRDESYN